MWKGRIIMNVAVLGDGMLGSAVSEYLRNQGEVRVTSFTRKDFDASVITQKQLNSSLSGFDWVINCIGIIKPRIKGDAEEAIRVNALFPHLLKNVPGINVIQIATDCVFSGKELTPLDEQTPHDPTDIYGMTKSLGEPISGYFYNLRCSIIGTKPGNTSLLQWFLDLESNAIIDGYADHLWNGITTLAFAKICYVIMQEAEYSIIQQHIIPAGFISKCELLMLFAKAYHREDITIQVKKNEPSYRILQTIWPDMNERLWQKAGYDNVPTIEELVYELKEWSL